MNPREYLDLAARMARGAASGVESRLQAILEGHAGFSLAACGSTALGIEAALADAGGGRATLFKEAGGYVEAHGHGARGPVIGLSMSGHSTEVREVLEAARGFGEVTAFVTGGSPMPGAGENLQLDLSEMPRRYLPLAACILAHSCLGSRFAAEPGGMPGLASLAPPKELHSFLAAAYHDALSPVFISAAPGMSAGVLASQYMEFLKRPAIHLAFPAWTHDFLWSLRGEDAGRLVLIHERPRRDLGDGRFDKALDRIRELGIRQLPFDLPWPGKGGHPASTWLASVLQFYAGLAMELGIDPHAEASFGH